MGVLILGVNTLYRLFCFFKLFLMVGKGLRYANKLLDDVLKIWVQLQIFSLIRDETQAFPVLAKINGESKAWVRTRLGSPRGGSNSYSGETAARNRALLDDITSVKHAHTRTTYFFFCW